MAISFHGKSIFRMWHRPNQNLPFQFLHDFRYNLDSNWSIFNAFVSARFVRCLSILVYAVLECLCVYGICARGWLSNSLIKRISFESFGCRQRDWKSTDRRKKKKYPWNESHTNENRIRIQSRRSNKTKKNTKILEHNRATILSINILTT